MQRIQAILATRSSAIVAGLFVAAALVGAYLSVRSAIGPSEAARIANTRPFICSETQRGFDLQLQAGMAVPVRSPFSGKATGYPAERCYWSADGQILDRPVYVQMRSDGPTFCPNCDRLVRTNNPRPLPGDAPPPLQSAYLAARSDRSFGAQANGGVRP